jgi:hypothetical protein
MPSKIEMTRDALEIMTPEQQQSILRLSDEQHLVVVGRGMFDLPQGYLSFRSEYLPAGSSIYGGIAPDGQVST